MASVTNLGGVFTTTSGTKSVVATPAAGDLIIIFTAHTGNLADVNPTDDNSSGTYTQITFRVKPSPNTDKTCLYVRNSLIQAATSTTFQHAPGTTTGGGLGVLAISGITRVGLSAILQFSGQDNQAGGGTPAPVFGATPQSANPIVSGVFNATNPSGVTPRTGYSSGGDAGYNTPATGSRLTWLNSGETSATLTWGGTSASIFASICAEIDTTVPPNTPFPIVGAGYYGDNQYV